MTEARQQSTSAHPQGSQRHPQGQQPAGQASQGMPRSGNGQQTGVAPRRGSMASRFNMDPFEFFRMSPFAMMRRFMEEMEQQWAPFGAGRGEQGIAARGGTAFAPPLEIFEREGHLVVRADLPGLTKEDVQVEVTDDSLTIAGERRSEHDTQHEGLFRSERHYGTFHRHIPLPEGVDAAQVKASFQDGVLEVTMPAPRPQARGRQIEVQSGTASARSTPGGAAPQASSRLNNEPAQMPAGEPT